jgi:hypothetical protein
MLVVRETWLCIIGLWLVGRRLVCSEEDSDEAHV